MGEKRWSTPLPYTMIRGVEERELTSLTILLEHRKFEFVYDEQSLWSPHPRRETCHWIATLLQIALRSDSATAPTDPGMETHAMNEEASTSTVSVIKEEWSFNWGRLLMFGPIATIAFIAYDHYQSLNVRIRYLTTPEFAPEPNYLLLLLAWLICMGWIGFTKRRVHEGVKKEGDERRPEKEKWS